MKYFLTAVLLAAPTFSSAVQTRTLNGTGIAAPRVTGMAAALLAAGKLKLASPVGQAPAQTRTKLIETLDRFHLTDAFVALSGKQYHVSMQTTRDGQWAVALTPKGKKHFDMAASFPYRALRKTGGYAQKIDGATYTVSLVEDQGIEAMAFTDESGNTSAVAVSYIKQMVWEKAAPIPSLGPDWKFVFQRDLWIGAGMRTFVFLQKTDGGVVFHNVRAESVDWEPRARVKTVGDLKLSLAIDHEGKIVIKEASE